jgi:hypothetical protein
VHDFVRHVSACGGGGGTAAPTYTKSWTHPADVTDNISPDGEDGSAPQVAMENNGNAIITWLQSDGSKTQIFMSEYR